MTRRPVELIKLTKTDVEHALDEFGAESTKPSTAGRTAGPDRDREKTFDPFASEVRAQERAAAAFTWNKLTMPGLVAASVVAISAIVIVIANGSSSAPSAQSSSEPSAQAPDVTNAATRKSSAAVPSPDEEQLSLTALETRRIDSPTPEPPIARAMPLTASPIPSAKPLLIPAAAVSTTPSQPRTLVLDPVPVVATARLATENVAASIPPPPPSPAVPSAIPEPAARPVAPPNETVAIERVLSRYRDAYSALDAGAARDIWPTVNEKALERAFARLEEQDLAFANCLIAVTSTSARAECSGTARYVPKVGSKNPRLDQRQWNFSLRRDNEEWVIESVSAK